MFTQKADLTLIRLVKENPVLYDFNDAKYMDFNAREVAWQKIGDALKRPAADCKVRWIHIRDVNRRILKKAVSSSSKVRLYKYDSELAFMRPFYKDVFMENVNYEYNDDSGDRDLAEMPEEVDCGNGSDESDNKPIQKRKKYKSNARNKRKAEKAISPAPTNNIFDKVICPELDPKDPLDAFLLSIRPIMKGLTPFNQHAAKTKIFVIVQDIELQQIMQSGVENSNDMKVTNSIYSQK